MNTFTTMAKLSRTAWVALILLWIGVALATTAHAQQAQISGTVTDATGALVPRVKITVTSPDTGLVRTISSNEKGFYLLALLPPGRYELQAEKEGFREFVQSGIRLDVGQEAGIDISLQVGNQTQTVSVTGGTPLLETTSAEVSAVMDPVRMTELPLNGRNAVELAGLLPGVSNVFAPEFITNTNGGPTMDVSGGRASQNLMLYDGSTYTGDFRNVSGMFAPPDWLLEFKVSTNMFGAEYGGNSGSVVSAVTKSGTNEFHGNFYEFLRNSDLNARDYFTPTKSSLIQNQFGFSIGGPVLKNKLFYFGGLEWLKVRPAGTSVTAYPPTTAERAGNFSAISTPIIDPLTGQQFDYQGVPNTINPSRLDPVAVALMNPTIVPLPNQANGSYFSSAASPTNMYSGTFRVDYQASNRNLIFDRFFRDDANEAYPFSDGNMKYSPSVDGSSVPINNVVGWTFIISPKAINQFRASMYYTDDIASETGFPTLAQLGMTWPTFGPSLPAWFSVSGSMDLAGTFPANVSHHQYEVSDDVSLLKGQHSIKFGGRYHKNDAVTATWGWPDGFFNFDGSVTGNPIADFMIGEAQSVSVVSRGWFSSFQDNAYDFYIQDDWHASSALTLNLGVHYQLQLPWYEGNNQWSSVWLGSGYHSTVYPQAPVNSVYAGDPGVPRGLVNTDWHQIEPRLGFAYAPRFLGSKTVVRGGVGLFGEQVNGDILQNTMQPFQLNFTEFDRPLHDPLVGTPYATNINPDAGGIYFVPPYAAEFPSRNYTLGYVFAYNLFIQHQFGQNSSVEIGYVGKQSRKLMWFYPVNAAPYETDPITGQPASESNVQDRRPYGTVANGQYADLEEENSNGNASYNALQLQVIHRLTRGFSLQGAYTFAKSIDDSSSSTEATNLVNPFIPSSNRGLSDFDQRQIANVNLVDALPNWGDEGIEKALLHNWEVSGILTMSTGFPVSIISGQDRALAGDGQQTPNLVGSPAISHPNKKADIAEWFNTSAYALPAIGTFGDVGRNTVEGPGAWLLTGGLYRNFPFDKERYRIQFRSEFFNLLNHTNLGNPDGNLSDGTFGHILGDNTGSNTGGRVIQFALKIFY
jgi:hypothetical protein